MSANVVDQTEEGGPRTPAAERCGKAGTKTGSGSSGRGTIPAGGSGGAPEGGGDAVGRAEQPADRERRQEADRDLRGDADRQDAGADQLGERRSPPSRVRAPPGATNAHTWNRTTRAVSPRTCPAGSRARELPDEHRGHRGEGGHQREVVRQPEVRVTGLVQDRGARARDRRHGQVRRASGRRARRPRRRPAWPACVERSWRGL